VQGVAGGEARDRFEPVAVEYGGVMVAGLDHDEQVQRIGGEGETVGQRAGGTMDNTGSLDLFAVPNRHLRQRRVDPFRQRLDIGGRELAGKAGHLRCAAPGGNNFQRLGASQPLQVLRQ
jgi:hypothetical protein